MHVAAFVRFQPMAKDYDETGRTTTAPR